MERENKTEAPERRFQGIPGKSLDGCAERQSGPSALVEYIHTLRRKANLLEALFNALPRELSPQADEALWDMVMKLRR